MTRLASGSAYVFVMPSGGWVTMTETAKLIASNGAVDDHFGRSVSISGDVIVVGAFSDDDANVCGCDPSCDSGSAYVYGVPGLDCNRNGQPDACDIFLGVSCDSNENGIPDECEIPPCPADFDGSGDVGVNDLLFLLGNWGPCPK